MSHDDPETLSTGLPGLEDSSLAPPEAGPPPLPSAIGRFRIVRRLGQGGMGEVYEGIDERLERRVAVKRILGFHRTSPEARARFWREARSLAALGHPGIVTIHELGDTAEGDLFIVMELLHGQPLSELLAAPWPHTHAARVVRDVARALGAAHAAGITHRDIKPANLLLEPSGAVRVLDFGLARRTEDTEDAVTASGLVVGTPAYMSPEQVRAGAVGPPSDVFTLGTLLYRMLTGSHPFARPSSMATALAVAGAEHAPIELLRPDLPGGLIAAIGRCLSVDPLVRFSDGAALADALDAVLEECGGAPSAASIHGLVDAPGSGGAPLATEDTLAPSQQRQPPETPQITPAPPEPTASRDERLPAPERRGRRALVGLTVAALVAGALGWMATRPEPAEPPAAPPPPARGAAWVARPPRPVVAVLGFGASPASEGLSEAAAVAADVARVTLDLDPTHVLSMQLPTLRGLLPGGPPPLDTDPRSLHRTGRTPGNIDLVVTGTLERDEALALSVRVVETSGGAELLAFTARGADAIALGREVARRVMPLAGGRMPDAAPELTRSTDAYAAYLRGREAAFASDDGAAAKNLEWALQLDPAFALAAVAQLGVLRSERRYDELSERATALLGTDRPMPERVRAVAAALLALADGRPRECTRELHALLERFVLDAEATQYLLAMRFNEAETVDLREAERLARDLLTVGPGFEAAASRLVRSLAWRGRADEAATALTEYKIPKQNNGFVIDPWGELAVYRGEYDLALARFTDTTLRTAGSIYAEHMAIAALVLAGRCKEATDRALDRIAYAQSLGPDSNLDWTYSLAFQSLLCQEQWDPALDVMDEWAGHSATGRAVLAENRLRVAFARGAPADEVRRQTLSALSALPDDWEQDRAPLLRMLGRVSTDAGELRALASRAGRAAVDVGLSRSRQLAYGHAEQCLLARALMVEGHTKEALEAYDAAVMPWDDVRNEGDLGLRVDMIAHRAWAQEAAHLDGQASQSWREIVDMAYPRLWSTDLWVIARQRYREASP